ncbi:type II secretion system F family protein [Actinokineospora pegani]|uniref:type II secretion system F family protein n=1 Tax=Actinokineospora pegani TaxID=2654637 RepID=UPI0012EA2259|nr:type II secretion system F family protein [Actinokineospora pegani]
MSLLLLAAALLIGGRPNHARRRLVALGRGPARARARRRFLPARSPPVDRLGLAGGWDLLAAGLAAGLPVPTAVRAVAADLPERVGGVLRDAADLLALGADPGRAWAAALACPETAELARGARRSSRSGAALAGIARDLAAGVRERAVDLAEERAQRAAVRVTAPLGLFFLPAFLCLGVVPVVIGLVTRVSAQL